MKIKKIKPMGVIIFLVILLIIAGTYICYDKYAEKREKKEFEMYMKGV